MKLIAIFISAFIITLVGSISIEVIFEVTIDKKILGKIFTLEILLLVLSAIRYFIRDMFKKHKSE